MKFVPVGMKCITQCQIQSRLPIFPAMPVLIPPNSTNVSLSVSISPPHLVLNSLAVFGVADHCQLQLGHLLHLPVHVNLLQQAADLAPQQAHRILLPLALGQQRGTGRMDGCHPVLQVSLVAGLEGQRGTGR